MGVYKLLQVKPLLIQLILTLNSDKYALDVASQQ